MNGRTLTPTLTLPGRGGALPPLPHVLPFTLALHVTEILPEDTGSGRISSSSTISHCPALRPPLQRRPQLRGLPDNRSGPIFVPGYLRIKLGLSSCSFWTAGSCRPGATAASLGVCISARQQVLKSWPFQGMVFVIFQHHFQPALRPCRH